MSSVLCWRPKTDGQALQPAFPQLLKLCHL